jgi:hypothetical protein
LALPGKSGGEQHGFEVIEMKVKETVGAIGFFTLVGAETLVLAVAGAVQVAAAGVALVAAAPFATGRNKSRARELASAPRDEGLDVRLPRAA